jgi:hypothetical protein
LEEKRKQMLINFLTRYHEQDSGGGSGSGSDTDANVTGSFQRRLERFNNDAMLMANELYRENFRERESNRRLRDQVTELQGRIPAEGAHVLSADEAKLWTAYQAMGQPTELQQRIEQGQTAIQERDGLRRDTTIRQAADAAGYKPSVLARLAGDVALSVREADGKQEALVTVEGQQPVPLTEYAQQHWADFLPALTAQSQGQQQQTGVPFVPQTGNGTPPKPQDMVAAFLQQAQAQRDSASNPLKRG